MNKQFKAAELATLRRLRDGFLTKRGAGGDYWQSQDELALYDSTLGERIGWKWDAVLQELTVRGWSPKSRYLIDWGCGSGVAGRRILNAWPDQFETLTVHDRSMAAMAFAASQARAAFPKLTVNSQLPDSLPAGTLLVLSHVLNELPASVLNRLLQLIAGAEEIIWVEAGAAEESRHLSIEIRNRLIEAGFSVVGPCTHAAMCGLADAKNAAHWCHSFGRPPSAAAQSARWHEFSRELGIDLRALPYSFLALSRQWPGEAPGASRVIGKARDYKGFSKVLSCQSSGLEELMLQKRDALELLKQVREDVCPPVYRWSREGNKIVG